MFTSFHMLSVACNVSCVMCHMSCVEGHPIFNRPYVAGAVLKTLLSFIHPFPPNLQNLIIPKLLELGT